ncbi:BlaI/MecI/CopY family transcriptional regulator [Streptomyces sp. NPDC059256]|uniref:BlaI/MecI/CopY family transcriptional regulator n=1 Tax=Streptomyces sp. NPDC059256 TaxID=3346794 RepID=UPI0036CF8919
MTRVWQWNRPVTVREVLEDLQQDRSIAYTTVMTVMDNLHQKGWVRREVEGRAYRYTAVSTRAAYSAALMNEAWSKSDNPAAALVAFFGMMSPEQREALQAAVRMVGGEPVPNAAEEGDSTEEGVASPEAEAEAEAEAEGAVRRGDSDLVEGEVPAVVDPDLAEDAVPGEGPLLDQDAVHGDHPADGRTSSGR